MYACAAAGPPRILLDYVDITPADLACPFDQAVLPPTIFQNVHDLLKVDWRTYTMALRFGCSAAIVFVISSRVFGTIVSCRREFVTANAAGRVGTIPSNGASICRVGIDMSANLSR